MYGLYKAANDNQSVTVIVRDKSIAISVVEPDDKHLVQITKDLHNDHGYARHVVTSALTLVGVSEDLVGAVQSQMGVPSKSLEERVNSTILKLADSLLSMKR